MTLHASSALLLVTAAAVVLWLPTEAEVWIEMEKQADETSGNNHWCTKGTSWVEKGSLDLCEAHCASSRYATYREIDKNCKCSGDDCSAQVSKGAKIYERLDTCSAADGSGLSARYPCVCGSQTCQVDQQCTASSSTCETRVSFRVGSGNECPHELTFQECQAATTILNTATTVRTMSRSDRPAGCSKSTGHFNRLYYNSAESGKAFDGLDPVCKAASVLAEGQAQTTAEEEKEVRRHVTIDSSGALLLADPQQERELDAAQTMVPAVSSESKESGATSTGPAMMRKESQPVKKIQ